MTAEPSPHPVDVPAASPAAGAGEGVRLPPLAEVARSLAAALDVREVMQRVSTSAVELTRAYGAHVEQIVSAEGVVEVVAHAGEGTPSLGTRVPYPGSLTEEIIEAGIPSLVAEIGHIGAAIAPYLARSCEGCSALVVPLVSERQILGTLVLLGRPGAEFGDEELTHARVLGDLASVSLRRVLLLEEAERERREKTAVLERISDAFFALDPDWRFTFLNRAARAVVESFTREDPGEVVGKGFLDVLPQLRGTGVERELRRALDGQVSVHAEEYFSARGVWLELHAYPSDNGLSVFVRDVTARKRAELHFQLLAKAGAVLAASLDYRTTLAHVARLAVPALADWCVVDVVEDGRVERVEVAHADPEKAVRAQELRRYPPGPGGPDTPAGRVLRTGEPELIPEVTLASLRESGRSPEHVRLLREIGICSLMVVPLVARGEAIGSLAFIAAESDRRYGPEDLALAEELADRAAVAVENARLYHRAERRAAEEEAMRRAAEAVTATSTVEETSRRIAESAVQATRADSAFLERIDPARGEVRVLACAGEGTPPVGACLPYRGSFAELVVERGGPELIPALARAGRPLPSDLVRDCGECSAMVVPLLGPEEPIGALVLLRRPGQEPFRAEEAPRAHTFATLAALAFRKVRLLEEAEARREEIERVTESRTRLIRGFSHDLKNPLGAADGHAQLLEDGILGEMAPRQLESVKRIRATIRSALGLIQDLVELARAEAGQIELETAPADVGEVAREIAEEYRAQAEAAGLHVATELPDGLPRVNSDRNRVRQVLGNLLSNAVKYNRSGGRVYVRAVLRERGGEPEPRWIALEVADTGLGIPAGKRHLLFREFSRLEPGTVHGAGLGLAISQRIAHALGGEITLESEEGAGSTFTLWLPLQSEAP